MIKLMNYNVTRNETGQPSQLDKIQSAFLKSLKGKVLTKEQLKQIETMLVTNPNMMDEPEKYQGLERVGAEFELLKNSMLSRETTINENYAL